MAKDEKDDVDRRGALECMIWAGTGVLWTMAGGVPRSSPLGISEAKAQAASGFTFLQISDSHIGFKQAPNPNPLATLEEAIVKVSALPQTPAFMIHTGDITHLSKSEEFDNADQVIGKAKLETFYVPGEHDLIDENLGAAYLERYAKRTQAKGTGGMGSLGGEQLAWLADDLKGKSTSTPIVLFAHIPFWTVYAEWGWGTDDSAQALDLVKRFGSVTVLNGHIHQIMQKVEGTVTFHTARSTAFPMPAPGTAPGPGPMKVPNDRLRSVLGINTVEVKQGTQPLAITDSDLTKV